MPESDIHLNEKPEAFPWLKGAAYGCSIVGVTLALGPGKLFETEWDMVSTAVSMPFLLIGALLLLAVGRRRALDEKTD